jgi:hypothetical protein
MKTIPYLLASVMIIFIAGCSSAREAAPSSADSPLGSNPNFTGDYQVLRDMDNRSR